MPAWYECPNYIKIQRCLPRIVISKRIAGMAAKPFLFWRLGKQIIATISREQRLSLNVQSESALTNSAGVGTVPQPCLSIRFHLWESHGIYRAHNPRQSPLWQCTHLHYAEFRERYPEHYQPKQRPIRSVMRPLFISSCYQLKRRPRSSGNTSRGPSCTCLRQKHPANAGPAHRL